MSDNMYSRMQWKFCMANVFLPLSGRSISF
jgi:hypothetical protein